MTFRARAPLKRSKIEIIPMIDTMFFLLVFFMLSSLSLMKLQGLPVNLPKSANSSRQNKIDLTLTVTKDGQTYLNTVPVQIDDLGARLVAAAGGPSANLSEASVVINADEGVPYGMVIRCIDIAKGEGFTHFPLATNPVQAK